MKAFCDKNIRETTSKLAEMEFTFNGPLEKLAKEKYLKTLDERGLDKVECLKFW